ncbi:hypothetical protein [Mariprofundus ferrooxydans]|uniref:YtkA-like domain-containing protein n=1 Tax=Mariprofundus ferrooxydans PV-1 TaxID=314345 RepID=Q0F1J6_9PROT|nr:hypothetical protein [Mariprofundus ferrooxydans]EAU55195.1 hypothetical protein SPV1_10701 [Mariprofundus ferrooxydans PV-1]
MKKTSLVLSTLLAVAMSQPAMAGENMHGAMPMDKVNPCSMHSMHVDMENPCMAVAKGAFMVKKEIDGYTVSFHIMKAMAGMKHGASHHSGEGQDAPSHNVMIKFEKGGKAVTNLVANSKVVHPNGKSESKMLKKMGDWYMAGYNLDHPGKHQLMLLFKTADGVKHFGGIDYQAQGANK